jgi:hypothetical protein
MRGCADFGPSLTISDYTSPDWLNMWFTHRYRPSLLLYDHCGGENGYIGGVRHLN